MGHVAAFYADDHKAATASHESSSMRAPFMVKDRGWQEFANGPAEHPAVGAAITLRRMQGRHLKVYGLGAELAGSQAPLLGDDRLVALTPHQGKES